MAPVKGIQAEPVHPLPSGAWQCVHGPAAPQVGGGLQSWGKPQGTAQLCSGGMKAERRCACGNGGASQHCWGREGVFRLWGLRAGAAIINTGAWGLRC